MPALTKKEILEQLKKIGLSTASELNVYSREYEEYFIMLNPYTHSPREYHERAEDN